jgi:hypothetical protein
MTDVKQTSRPSFQTLTFSRHPADPSGERAIHKFDNGYAVSVIRGPNSYGGPDGFYELAILRSVGLDYSLCYDQTLKHPDGHAVQVDDVLGWLSPEHVTHYMHEVAALKRRTN